MSELHNQPNNTILILLLRFTVCLTDDNLTLLSSILQRANVSYCRQLTFRTETITLKKMAMLKVPRGRTGYSEDEKSPPTTVKQNNYAISYDR